MYKSVYNSIDDKPETLNKVLEDIVSSQYPYQSIEVNRMDGSNQEEYGDIQIKIESNHLRFTLPSHEIIELDIKDIASISANQDGYCIGMYTEYHDDICNVEIHLN